MSASVGLVGTLQAAASTYETTEALVEAVLEQCQQPIGSLQISALLESGGVTDTIAERRYGFQDVFTLAEALHRELSSSIRVERQRSDKVLSPDTWQERISDYARGPLALLPMLLLSLIIMVYQRFGQWENGQVLALGFSMLGSLLVTSGFVQGASRKGSSYLSQGYVDAARRIVLFIVGASALVVVLTALGGMGLLALGGWLPAGDVVLMAVAYIVLSCLWLVAAVLFMLSQVVWFGVSLGIGVSLSYTALLLAVQFPIQPAAALLVATGVGLVGILLTTILVARRKLQQLASASPVGRQPVLLPPRSHMVVNLAPYFFYGVLYVTFILSGHVPGWLGRVPGGVRITAISTVEVGLTLALGGYILVGGVAEHTIRRFWKRIQSYQLQTPQAQPQQFNQRLSQFFRQEQAIFLRALVFCSGLILLATLVSVHFATEAAIIVLPWTSATVTIFGLGLIGYGLMAWGIFNCMFMITLSRPEKAIGAIIIGIIVTLTLGITISLVVSYHYGIAGMVAGSLAFALVASRRLQEIWRRADYFYYASF
jgi:hypothetical protein